MEKTQKSILILGGTGIIGRYISSVALEQGFEVYSLSRSIKKDLDNRIKQIVGDFQKEGFINTIDEGYRFDAVVDLVSFTPDDLIRSLDRIASKTSQYIFTSSATIFKGSEGVKINESSPLVTSGWKYPLNKIDCEKALLDYASRNDIKYTIVRPYITYSEQRISFGPWENSTALNRLQSNAPYVIGSELSKTHTTLTHSHDLAVGIVGLINNPKAINEDFNITSEESMTWGEVYDTAKSILGSTSTEIQIPTEKLITSFPELKGKIEDRLMNRSFNTSKLRDAIPKFNPKYSTREGYSELLTPSSLDATQSTEPLTQGRIDKLISKILPDKSTKNNARSLSRSICTSSPKNRLKYVIGRSGLLYKVLTTLKGAVKKSRQDNYSIG